MSDDLARLHEAAEAAGDMSIVEQRDEAWKVLIDYLPDDVGEGAMTVTYLARDLRKFYEDRVHAWDTIGTAIDALPKRAESGDE